MSTESDEDPLDALEGETIELPASLVTRVYTVAAMSGWTPDVEDPFESLEGDVMCDYKLIAGAYLAAISNGWQPQAKDPVATKLMELGYLKPLSETET